MAGVRGADARPGTSDDNSGRQAGTMRSFGCPDLPRSGRCAPGGHRVNGRRGWGPTPIWYRIGTTATWCRRACLSPTVMGFRHWRGFRRDCLWGSIKRRRASWAPLITCLLASLAVGAHEIRFLTELDQRFPRPSEDQPADGQRIQPHLESNPHVAGRTPPLHGHLHGEFTSATTSPASSSPSSTTTAATLNHSDGATTADMSLPSWLSMVATVLTSRLRLPRAWLTLAWMGLDDLRAARNLCFVDVSRDRCCQYRRK